MSGTSGEENEDRAVEASKDLVQEYAQLAIEAMRSDSVLAHMPFVRSLALIPKAYLGLRDHLFIRKLEACLRRLDDVPARERREMVAKLDADPAYGRRVGEHLIELLERMESHRKPAMIGEIFGAYARGEINIRMLQRLVSAVERLPVSEIDNVRRFADSVGKAAREFHLDEESVHALANAGLTTPQSGFGALVHTVNETTKMFLHLNLDVRSGDHSSSGPRAG